MRSCLTRLLLLVLGLSPGLFASPSPMGQGLSGNYKLSYVGTDLWTVFRDDPKHKPGVDGFDFKKVGTPPHFAPIYMLHDPKSPSATIMGAGSDTPRLCEGTSKMLSIKLECTPLAKETWVDEKTKCGIKKLFVEGIVWNIKDDLRYTRTEAIIFDHKNTPKECEEFKKNLLAELDTDKATEFFKAMREAGLFNEEKDFADAFLLSHVYQANETDEKAVEMPEGNQTGAYELEYSGQSKTVSWNGETKENLVESKPFNAPDESVQPEHIDNILLFHDPNARSAKISGGGDNTMRKCELVSEKDAKTETYSCTLFKANEEEVGTGCTIEHWIKEEVTLSADSLPRYERIEQRQLMPSTQEGCNNYRKKISEELKEGSAELFFRIISKTGGIESTDKLGDTFQLVHKYTAKHAN
jgi:hypothetical protein